MTKLSKKIAHPCTTIHLNHCIVMIACYFFRRQLCVRHSFGQMYRQRSRTSKAQSLLAAQREAREFGSYPACKATLSQVGLFTPDHTWSHLITPVLTQSYLSLSRSTVIIPSDHLWSTPQSSGHNSKICFLLIGCDWLWSYFDMLHFKLITNS